MYIFFVTTYILYIETPRPNTNRHVHAHKCLHCAGIEPATSCVVGKYSDNYAKSVVKVRILCLDSVVGYLPFSLCVIHKEGQCSKSRDINRLMMIE
jgi:hypothetical protein